MPIPCQSAMPPPDWHTPPRVTTANVSIGGLAGVRRGTSNPAPIFHVSAGRGCSAQCLGGQNADWCVPSRPRPRPTLRFNSRLRVFRDPGGDQLQWTLFRVHPALLVGVSPGQLCGPAPPPPPGGGGEPRPWQGERAMWVFSCLRRRRRRLSPSPSPSPEPSPPAGSAFRAGPRPTAPQQALLRRGRVP